MGIATKTSWPKGKSGNPKGAPPKARRLTRALELAINRSIPVGDTNTSGRILLAELLRDLAIYGKAKLPDGKSLIIEPKVQVEIAKFIYMQVDGPVKAEVDVTSNGESISLTEDERSARIVAILDEARARRDRQVSATDAADVS